MLFISHDLKLVRFLAHEVAVMYLGLIVEHGEPDAIYAAPAHPYTRALLAAVPCRRAAARASCSHGEPPNPAARPIGLRLSSALPASRSISAGARSRRSCVARTDVFVACHLAHGERWR